MTSCMNEGASDLPIQGADVCAIVVTYHPDAGLPNRLSSVSAQTGAVVVVDNGSADAERSMLREAASDPKIDLLLNPENLGLARAINIGIQRAAALGYSWVLLLDQNSLADPTCCTRCPRSWRRSRTPAAWPRSVPTSPTP